MILIDTSYFARQHAMPPQAAAAQCCHLFRQRPAAIGTVIGIPALGAAVTPHLPLAHRRWSTSIIALTMATRVRVTRSSRVSQGYDKVSNSFFQFINKDGDVRIAEGGLPDCEFVHSVNWAVSMSPNCKTVVGKWTIFKLVFRKILI